MRPPLALALVLVVTTAVDGGVRPARAARTLCGTGAIYRGALIDLDVKGADLHDVLRLLADAGKVNLVIADGVAGRATVRLKRVPWDQAACTIAAMHKLTITVDGGILLVAPRPR